MSDALFVEHEIPQDSEVRMSTVFRSSVYMQERLGVYGRNHSSKIRNIYILTLYKVYLSALVKGAIPNHENAKKELAPFVTTNMIDHIIESLVFEGDNKPKRNEQLPKSMETIINEASRIVDREIARMYKYSTKNQSNSL